MKKIIFIVFILISSVTYGQTVRSLIGLNPTTSMPGYIYRDTSLTLPYSPLQYITGYGTFGTTDSLKGVASFVKNATLDSFILTLSNGTRYAVKDSGSSGGGSGWGLTGNAGTTPITNFLGTTDSKKLYIRTNNILKAWVDSATSQFYIDSFPIWRGRGKGFNLSSIAIGDSSLNNNSTGIGNTIIGDSAGIKNSTGNNNTAIGYGVYANATSGLYNTAIGGQSMGIGITTGSYNTAIGGLQALYRNTSGSHNFASGYLALANNTIGDHNIAIGDQSQNNNTGGSGNISFGQGIMNSASFSGTYNIGIGLSSLAPVTSGTQNVAVGYGAANSNTTGSSNCALGSLPIQYNATGSYNVAIGNLAGKNILGGANGGNTTSSIFIGDSTRMRAINQIHQIVIGNNVTGNGSYTTVLGDSSTLSTQIYGITSLSYGTAVASASAITATGNTFHVTGTTNITSLNGTNLLPGANVTIIFDGILTFTDGSNLKLAGNFTTSADATISGVWDGTNFIEKGRSIN